MAATAAPLAVVACGGTGAGAGSGFLPSSSRMSAPRPRPSAFLAIRNHLFRKMDVALCAFSVDVVKNDGFAKTGRLREAHVARNDALEDLSAEERVQVAGYLP